MTDEKLEAVNLERIHSLDKTFALKVSAVLTDLERHGYRPRIQEGYRSPADQLEAYNTGHSKLKFGFHNITGQGGSPRACAVDILDDDRPLSASTRFNLMLASSAWAHELDTGTLWGLTARQRGVVLAAVAAKEFDKPVRLGWDEGHVQVLTALSARDYWRLLNSH